MPKIVVTSYNGVRGLQREPQLLQCLWHTVSKYNFLASNLERHGFDGQMEKELAMSNELQSAAQSPSETQQ